MHSVSVLVAFLHCDLFTIYLLDQLSGMTGVVAQCRATNQQVSQTSHASLRI